ncbi:MAG: AAA family ATPase, partial [Succinivibrionaceae bacterium]|nr:AAA family ATPase [Succinivibrionaceae bacterium]
MKEIADGQSFENIISDQQIYVDKTQYIYNFLKIKSRLFLSRPRRFGKSLVLDTIATLFEKGVEPYFKDTWIYDKWKEKTYPVLRLNFLD